MKYWRIALLVVLLPLLLASIAIGWLCYTASGLQFALLQLNHLPSLQVQVQGVSGRLAGPLHIERLVLEHERVHLDVEQLDIDLTPAYLLSGLIEVNRLQVQRLNAVLKPPIREQPLQPVHFLPAFLRISIDELRIQQAHYLHTSGYRLEVRPLTASIDLSHWRLRARQLNVVTPEFDARGMLVLQGGLSLALQADLAANYRINKGPTLRAQLQANGALTGNQPQLQFNAQLQQPHQAIVNGVLRLGGDWNLQGNARAAQVKLDAWWSQPAFSLQQLTLQFALNSAGMHYAGETRVPEWSPTPLHFDAQAHYAQRVLSIERAEIAVPSAGIVTHTQGSISLREDSKPWLDLRSSWSNLQWPLHAAKAQALFTSAQGSINIKGAQPYHFNIGADMALPQWPQSPVQASGEFRAGEINLQSYRIDTLQGTLQGDAALGLNAPRNWCIALRASGINPGVWHAQWSGQVSAQASATGQGWDRNALFDVQLRTLSGTLRNQSLHGSGRLQRARDHWRAERVRLQWGRAQLTAQGSVGKQNDLQWTLAAPLLSQLHPDLDGDVKASGEVRGSADAPQLALRAQSTQLLYAGWKVQGLQLDSNLDLTDQSASHLQVQAAVIDHDGSGLRNLRINGDGSTAMHQLQLQATPIQPLLPRDLQLQLQASGSYADKNWQGMLDNLQVSDAQATRMQLLMPVAMSVGAQQARLQSLCLRVDQGRACVTGSWRAQAGAEQQAWQLQAEIEDLPLSLRNAELIDSARLQARLRAQLNFAATGAAPWQGFAQMQLQDASIRYKLPTGREQVLPISTAAMTLQADARTIQVDGDARMGEQTIASLNATVDRRGAGLDTAPLSGVIALSSSDAKLIPVFVSNVDRAAGTLAGVLQLSGTALAPTFSGNFSLLDGELDFYQINLALRGMQLNAQLDDNQVRFQAQGSAGPGRLSAIGAMSWRDQQLLGNLQLKGNDLLVADLPEYRVLASPDLQFTVQDRDIAVKGEVLIPEARLQPTEVAGAVQSSADARYTTDKVVAGNSPWRVTSDVTVRLGEAVQFDGLGLQGKLSGAVDTRLRNADVPRGSGELSIVNGRYEAYGQKLEIQRGRLIFDNSPLTDPALDIQAERVVRDADANNLTVGVYVRGTPRAPRLQFYSDSSLSQTQIVSYLLVGKPLDGLQGQEANTVRSATNTLALQGGGFLASKLGRRVGLEEIGVETDAKNQSALVLGKFLSPRLFISYGISLTEAINTVKLRYTVSDHWTLKTEAGAAQSADIEFKIDR